MTVRVLIADDEPVARRRLRRLLQREPDFSLVAECADGAEALRLMVDAAPDLVLLDVQMPELDGFEVLQRFPGDRWPAVIFVTAFDRYALRAFDVHAIDYLLKPFSPERFRTAIARARTRLSQGARDGGLAGLVEEVRRRPAYLTRVAVALRGRTILLDVMTIDWVQAADNYVTLHAGGREYLVRDTLAALERQLDPDRFARIHRSTIVNLDRIAQLEPATHGDGIVQLHDGTRLVITRTWRDRVVRALKPGDAVRTSPITR
jgi:two-component system, LytTR family, response regulator